MYFLETPCTRVLTFRFHKDEVTLTFDELPSIQDATAMLMELAGVTRAEMFRSMMPLLKKERLQSRLRSFTTTNVHGTLSRE